MRMIVITVCVAGSDPASPHMVERGAVTSGFNLRGAGLRILFSPLISLKLPPDADDGRQFCR